MAEPHQMDVLIRDATEQVAQEGMKAPDKMVLLAGFGWLGEKLDRLPTNGNSRKNGRKAMVVKVVLPAGGLISVGVAGLAILEKLVK